MEGTDPEVKNEIARWYVVTRATIGPVETKDPSQLLSVADHKAGSAIPARAACDVVRDGPPSSLGLPWRARREKMEG